MMVIQGDESILEQICKQLSKLIDVAEVIHLNKNPWISRELMLVKCAVEPATRPELFGIVETFRSSVIDVGMNSVIIQVVGDTDKNNAFLKVLDAYGIIELTRTGETAMNRGEAFRQRTIQFNEQDGH
ncbi:acetolactate synthase small subunit [Paenibacillus sp. SI8]|uniref:acetolactate synthase small subunit n=1 Tax=unclassified Paenibacillus TaxID=185978 RepID=UPI0034664BCD